MEKKYIAIALDGPAGAGKSTVAKKVAERLDAIYLDTGAMYRAMGLYMHRIGVDPRDAAAVADTCEGAHIEVRYLDGQQRVFLNGEDVSGEIRTPQMGAAASAVSAVGKVRDVLVPAQREFALRYPIVMDGRDIGTKVLPDAPLKVFLTASAEERARRRVKQLKEDGKPADFAEILDSIIRRDHDDSTRAVSPLCQAEDAILLDSTEMSAEQVVETIISWARERKLVQ